MILDRAVNNAQETAERARASNDVSTSKYFPFKSPHMWLRNMDVLQQSTPLLATQLAMNNPDQAAEVMDDIDEIATVTNDARKIDGFFLEKEVASLAKQYTDGSLCSPVFDRDLTEYVMALLHCKLNIMGNVFFPILLAADRKYSEVMLQPLRKAFDHNSLLKRINIATTLETRQAEQKSEDHGMHTSMNGKDCTELQRSIVDIVQSCLPLPNFIPLEFDSSKLDGYGYVADPHHNSKWYESCVEDLDGLKHWCCCTSNGNPEMYLYAALVKITDESSFIATKLEYTEKNYSTPTQNFTLLDGERIKSKLENFFDTLWETNFDPDTSTYTRRGLGSGFYRGTSTTADEMTRMQCNPGMYLQAQACGSGILQAVLPFNDAYGLMACKTGALRAGEPTEAVADDVVADIVKYYELEGMPQFETRRGRQYLTSIDLTRIRARQFFDALIFNFGNDSDCGLDEMKISACITDYVHMIAEHGDQMMIDVWRNNLLPYGETTEQSAESYISSVNSFVKGLEARKSGDMRTDKHGKPNLNTSTLYLQTERHVAVHPSPPLLTPPPHPSFALKIIVLGGTNSICCLELSSRIWIQNHDITESEGFH